MHSSNPVEATILDSLSLRIMAFSVSKSKTPQHALSLGGSWRGLKLITSGTSAVSASENFVKILLCPDPV
jgi:hypothetical protein